MPLVTWLLLERNFLGIILFFEAFNLRDLVFLIFFRDLDGLEVLELVELLLLEERFLLQDGGLGSLVTVGVWSALHY